ncbi:DUF4350 domain-containing protein [Haloferax sp. DFSO52]|uniref:DUF4350 domain-containing protein n=1 Tax=Haloferax sp. DFSO52 TaxID=3388505 RepID=UPI003A868FA3
MRIGSSDIGYPHLLVAGLLTAMLLGVGVGASTSGTAYGAFNSAWDGGSALRDVATDAETETSIVYNTTEYDEATESETIAFVISPTNGYTDAEAARLESFVRAGGTLVVADDFRLHSNALLERIGASARIDQTPLRDDRHQYKTGALPVATRVESSPVTRDVDQLSLNHPTTVSPNGSTVLVRSSNFSYLDRDDDATLDDDETLDSYPIVTIEQVGAGEVIVVSDPSLFINSMVERPDNRAFADALVGSHETLLLDYSNVDERPPLQVALNTIRSSPFFQFVAGGVALSALVAVARFGRNELD